MSTSRTIRALSTVARRHVMSPNRVVFSDFATRILPNLSSTVQPPNAAARQPQLAQTMHHDDHHHHHHHRQPPLDPCDYGYRVVDTAQGRPPLYTSTVVTPREEEGTHSTLGSITRSTEYEASEIMAAQEEWDMALDMESTRPHFEFYKEDPYHQEKTVQGLFSCIDSHDENELWEEAA